MLSPAERTRWGETPENQRATFVAGRVLLRELASDLLGISPALVQIAAMCVDCGGSHGRPELVGAPYFLSLSHTPEAVVAVASDSRVGVDAEPNAGSAARVDAVEKLTGRASIAHWTAVEAILKADGRGLRVDPREVEVDGAVGSLHGARYRLLAPDIDPGLTVTVAQRLA